MNTSPNPARAGYHHGNLVEALLDAAIALIEEKGVDAMTVREVAKRAGVSPGAPFRHFSNKAALLTAVAEQAMTRLTDAVRAELAAAQDDPIEGIRAIGHGYLTWALANPTHFQVISSRTLIDFHGSQALVDENEAIRQIMVDLLARARRQGRLRDLDPDDLMYALRAFVYGTVRMWVDQHYREWKIAKPPVKAMSDALDLFIGLIGADPTAAGQGASVMTKDGA